MGRVLSTALAAEGCRVGIHCWRSRTQAQRLAQQLRRRGALVFVVCGDLTTEVSLRRVWEQARREAGRIHILINNAAVFHKDPLDTVTEDRLLEEWRPNLIAPILLTRLFAEQVPASRSGAPAGKVINLLDRRISGWEIDAVPYWLSKNGLASFTRIAALALAPRITVNAVAPGAVLPPATAPSRRKGTVFDLAGRTPLRVRCTPADVARAVLFLLREDALTGQVIFVDAGQHLLAGQSGRAPLS